MCLAYRNLGNIMSNVEYFYDLNYSLANEDTAFEREIVLNQEARKNIKRLRFGLTMLSPVASRGTRTSYCRS